MDPKNRNLLVRVLSAVILLPIVLWLIWLGDVPMAILVGVAAAIVASELYGIVGLKLTHPAALAGMLFATLPAFFALDLARTWPLILAALAFAPILSLSLLTLMPPGNDLGRAASLAAFTAMGPPHVGIGLAAAVALRQLPETGLAWILIALVVTWGQDTGAYFSGRLFGRHKLYPLVSPNKTWEGFGGGMVAAIAGCFLVRAFFFPEFSVVDCLVVGGVAGVLGPLGDLSESMLKRAFGVKDSGKIMPGHGGLYDRVDALLFNAPWVFAYAWLTHDLVTTAVGA
jgi:phosphatidate cytidylyltransferase